jgi:nicotinamidase/pyrazinamidase
MKALLLIDLQNDFVPGGALAVANGDQTIEIANQLLSEKGRLFDIAVATQDWHPSNHKSFAANNGAEVGSMGTLGGLPQVMWPTHCVQGSSGAEFVKSLEIRKVDKIVQKGTDPQIDSYSGFFDNGHKKATELASYLKSQNVDEVIVMGLATDYCVKFTALDARELGLKTTLIRDGSRAVNLHPGDEQKAIDEMVSHGVRLMTSAEFQKQKQN